MASAQTTKLLTDLQNSGLQRNFPQLYDIVHGLLLTVDGLATDVITIQSVVAPGGLSSVPDDVAGFSVELDPNEVVFNFTNQGFGILYELRVGSSWDSASYVTTSLTNRIPINPLLYGTYTYLVKAINGFNRYSLNASSVTFTINEIGQITATTQVITNNVLFFWTAPSSTFTIAYYNIYKDGVSLGTVNSTFFTYFEIRGGTYEYEIQAVDIAGNVGPTGNSATLTLPNPTDYILHASVTDDFSGSKADCKLDRNGYLLAPVDITKTYEDHFIDNAWATPAAQVAAGYSRFIQPNVGAGTYTQVFDFGTIVSAVIVNLFYSVLPVVNTVAILFQIEVSDDNITYDIPQNGTSRFASSCRYARVTITFTPGTDKTMIYLTSLEADLNVHLENDGGNITCNAGDAGGTTVTFNKSFLEVISITTIVKQTVPRDVIIDYVYTTLNPTTFKILVFDNAGVRQTETVGWAARGILV